MVRRGVIAIGLAIGQLWLLQRWLLFDLVGLADFGLGRWDPSSRNVRSKTPLLDLLRRPGIDPSTKFDYARQMAGCSSSALSALYTPPACQVIKIASDSWEILLELRAVNASQTPCEYRRALRHHHRRSTSREIDKSSRAASLSAQSAIMLPGRSDYNESHFSARYPQISSVIAFVQNHLGLLSRYNTSKASLGVESSASIPASARSSALGSDAPLGFEPSPPPRTAADHPPALSARSPARPVRACPTPPALC